MQGRNRDTDIENELVDIVRKGEGGMNLESSTDICTLPCVKQMASGKLPHRHRELSSAPCDDLRDEAGVGGRKAQERGDKCIRVADALHCAAEINTTRKAIKFQ